MSQITLTIEQLNKMEALEITTSPIVRDKFINIYDTLWGAGTGEQAYERESIYFNKLLRDTPSLQKGTRFSLFTAFIDLAVCGLSLEQGTPTLAHANTQYGKDESCSLSPLTANWCCANGPDRYVTLTILSLCTAMTSSHSPTSTDRNVYRTPATYPTLGNASSLATYASHVQMDLSTMPS